jgi:hypothetical protein
MTIGLGIGLQVDLQIGREIIRLRALMGTTQNGSTRIVLRARLVHHQTYKNAGAT